MYGNYQYNPYLGQQMYKPIETPIQPQTMPQMGQKPLLNGKQVESIEVVKAIDIPLDGTISYFPIADGSAIVSKQLQLDGTSKTIIYKPIEEGQIPKYATIEDINKAIKEIDLTDIDDLKDDLKDIRAELKELKKKKKDD